MKALLEAVCGLSRMSIMPTGKLTPCMQPRPQTACFTSEIMVTCTRQATAQNFSKMGPCPAQTQNCIFYIRDHSNMHEANDSPKFHQNGASPILTILHSSESITFPQWTLSGRYSGRLVDATVDSIKHTHIANNARKQNFLSKISLGDAPF